MLDAAVWLAVRYITCGCVSLRRQYLPIAKACDGVHTGCLFCLSMVGGHSTAGGGYVPQQLRHAVLRVLLDRWFICDRHGMLLWRVLVRG